MTRKPLIVLVCLAFGALVAMPGTAAAGSSTGTAKASGGGGLVNSLAAGACAGERQKIGKRAFRKRYGAGKRAAKACSKHFRKQANGAIAEATAECQGEIDDYGEEEFYFEWESFSECVADYAAWIMEGGTFEEDDSDEEDEEDDDDEFELPLPPLSAAA